jgi:hypothetical protein
MSKLNEVSDTLARSRQRWTPSKFSVFHKLMLLVHKFPNFGNLQNFKNFSPFLSLITKISKILQVNYDFRVCAGHDLGLFKAWTKDKCTQFEHHSDLLEIQCGDMYKFSAIREECTGI